MATPTTTYSLSKPTVGGDDNAWGTELNNNLDKLDDLLDGTLSITPNLATGWEVGGVAVTSTAAELNILDGVTASTAEINILDGVTASTAEINILDGVTATASDINLLDGKSLSGSDTEIITGTAGTDGDIVQWNADGDLVSYGAATQLQATWEAGTGTTESLVSPAKVKAAIDALVPEGIGVGQTWQNVTGSRTTGTAYQNTTGRPIMIAITRDSIGAESLEISNNGISWDTILATPGQGSDTSRFQLIIPDQLYYRYNGGAAGTTDWWELR